MQLQLAYDHFLVACFRDFYIEFARIRAGILADPWRISGRDLPELEKDALRVREVEEISGRIRLVLERQAREAELQGGESLREEHREAQYVMAALADELMLHTDWEGRSLWQTNLIEAKLFGSRFAGERFYEHLERLLENPVRSTSAIGVVYLLALSMGFEGQHRGSVSGAESIERYRTRLRTRLRRAGANPEELEDEAALCPQAYRHTVVQRHAMEIPALRPWVVAMIAGLLLYGVVSHVAWNQMTAELRDSTTRILRVDQ
jgi:type VI secretion system protein ImpK